MDYQEIKRQGIQAFLEDEIANQADRVERFVEINEMFGPQGDKLLMGGLQSELALHELANSYVNGNYMAVTLLCQAFIEHSLSGEFALRGQNTLAESTFKKIIVAALDAKLISHELYDSLDELRKLRNPYVHAKIGLKNGSLPKKMMDGGFQSVESLSKFDAFKSLFILKSFMDDKVIMWFNEEDA